MSAIGRPGRLLEAPGNRRHRGMVVTRRIPAALQNPAYRPADTGGLGGTTAGPPPISAHARMAMTDDADRIIGLYQRRAHEFDRERWRNLFERPWLDRFAALVGRGGSILDIGCGSGQPIARHFIESGYVLTGIDSSLAMIDLCRSRFPHATWIVADMRTLNLGTRHDGILAWDSFFHLRRDDQRAMFATFRAHAAAQTALMFTNGSSDGSDRDVSRRAALSREPCSGGISRPARPTWLRRHGAQGGRSVTRRAHGLGSHG